jgi:hypothetical protein
MNMTIQTLFNAWQANEIDPSVNPPATEAEIQAAEKKIGTRLPRPLREVYQLFNGGWMWELEFFPLEPTPKDYGLTRGNEQFIEYGWDIPQEVRLFALEGARIFLASGCLKLARRFITTRLLKLELYSRRVAWESSAQT